MKIHAINNHYAVSRKVTENQNNNKNHNTNSQTNFKLPSISFTMAQSNINMSPVEQELRAKYFSKNQDGETIFFNLKGEELNDICEEIKIAPFLLKYAFLTPDSEENLPAHRYLYDELKIMKDQLESVEGGKEILQTVFSHTNNRGELPAHSIIEPEELELTEEVTGRGMSLFTIIMTTKDKQNNYPANYYDSDTLDTMVRLMSKRRKALFEVLTNKNDKDNQVPFNKLSPDTKNLVYSLLVGYDNSMDQLSLEEKSEMMKKLHSLEKEV